MIHYEIQNLEAAQRGGIRVMSEAEPWTLILTVRVSGSDQLGEILTDVEQRLKSAQS
jgi:hypothetical protein